MRSCARQPETSPAFSLATRSPSACTVRSSEISEARCGRVSRVDSRACWSSEVVSLPTSAQVVVVGGGIVGTSAAYHLAKLGVETLLLEQNLIGGGTTWHAAGMVTRLRTTAAMA